MWPKCPECGLIVVFDESAKAFSCGCGWAKKLHPAIQANADAPNVLKEGEK